MEEKQPAFPCIEVLPPTGPGMPPDVRHHNGLSKRELLAALALQGLISSTPSAQTVRDAHPIANAAVQFADALLEALSR